MAKLPRPSETKISSVRGTEVSLKQPMPEGQPCGFNGVLFKLSPDESNSIIAEANLDAQTKTLNIILREWNAVLVGNSKAEQVKNNCHLDNKQSPQQKLQKRSFEDDLQADSGPKEQYCIEQQKTIIKEDEYQLQPLNEANTLCKQAPPSEVVVDVEPQLPLIKIQGYLNGPECEHIMEQLQSLLDDGEFEKHECLVTSYLNTFVFKNNTDMALALKIERGVACSYHKDFKHSKRLFTSVINYDSISQLRNANILLARAYYRLVQDFRYRKNRKLSALFHCMEKSEFLLQNHDSPEDWAEVYYNYGSLWLAYMSIIPDDERNAQARDDARRKARYYFEMTIESCKKDPRLRVQIKLQTFGHLRVAAVLLDCTSTVARIRRKLIPQQDIEDARRHLDILEHHLSSNIPRGTRVQILKARSDQYYRQGPGMYQLAKETAQEALRIARCRGFNTELESLQERIDFLDQLCEEAVCKERITLLVDSETSGNDASCETSGSETEKK
ncbi:uncharacterized protein LOC144636313 isoform X2 [Oculina patagonica]